ncbi:Mucolipin-2 [Halocaridina rubra]|uniref:Mucolipin-2 n=1 Tax=Halocaridina rubra TaxID=373956 RepID=A0AAN9AAR5_HALRR
MNAANHAQCNRSRSSRSASMDEDDHQSSEETDADATEPLMVSIQAAHGAQDGEQNIRGCNKKQLRKSLPPLHPETPRSDPFRTPRARSGSWSGVNESDDELERLAQDSKSSLPQIRVSQPDHTNSGSGRDGVISAESSGESETEPSYFQNSHTARLNSITANRMRRRLKFFFMNPMEKWHARRRFPWKLLLQIVKVIVITAQLCLFAQQRYNHVNYLWDTKISFSHLFIKGWDTSREIQVYPPADGPLAVYKRSDFFEYLDYSISTYARIREEAIGSYLYDYDKNGSVIPPVLCISQYASGHAFIQNNSYILNDNITKTCVDIPPSIANGSDWSVKKFLETKNITFDFDLLLNTDFTFELRTIKLRVNLPFDTPECYHLTGRVIFDNHEHDGQILVELDVAARVLECDGSIHLASESSSLKVWRTIMNILSIIVCVVSLIMCVRALYRGYLIMQSTVEFFRRYVGKPLTVDERMEFVNMWYILICINDILIIIGSFLKIGLESKSYEGFLDTWNVCSLFLGVGNMLVWFGLLRYLGFFKTYNVLILTVKKCFPNVLRFSICILMVFAGYSLCGWLVLGPYHLKFRSFSSTMECLYSLINGDDMFATFSSTSGKDPVVWWFSRIYLYSFISLFIYVILSLFIAIIMDAYETIKKYYRRGFPTSDLLIFINECTEEPSSGVFHDEGERTIHDVINSICCCGYDKRQGSGEYERIL